MSPPRVESNETDIQDKRQHCIITDLNANMYVAGKIELGVGWGGLGGISLLLEVNPVFISADQSDWSEETPRIHEPGLRSRAQASLSFSYWLLSFS